MGRRTPLPRLDMLAKAHLTLVPATDTDIDKEELAALTA